MPSVQRSLTTTTAPDIVYAYLADFANAVEWDPGTVECTRIDGDGGVGTRYRNVSSFLGRTTEVTYVAEELEPGSLLHFVGRNDQFTGDDLIRLRPHSGGTEVTYAADFTFHGVSRVAVPVVAAFLPVLARKTVDQLKRSLDGLGG